MLIRAEVFCEEFSKAGISRAALGRHTQTWQTPETLESYKQLIDRWNNSDNTYFRVVMISNAVAGLYLAYRSSDELDSNHVQVIQLAKPARRRGIGGALMRAFEANMANPNIPTTLEVLERNATAIGFYRHLGYEPTGAIAPCFIGGDAGVGREQAMMIEMQKDPVDGRLPESDFMCQRDADGDLDFARNSTRPTQSEAIIC